VRRDLDGALVNTRQKGVAFESEVAKTLEAGGWTVRGLERGGDHIAIDRRGGGQAYHVEAKRQEILEVPRWIRQVDRDNEAGLPWLLAFKRNREPAYVVLPLSQLVEMMQR
jgi:choline dehydrogenase-like flavoprotein